MKSDSNLNNLKSRQEGPPVPKKTFKPDKDISRKNFLTTSNRRSETEMQRDSQIDGSIMSGAHLRRSTVGSKPSKSPAPPVPPRFQSMQQPASSTSPEEEYFNSSILSANNKASLSSSSSSSSFYSYRRTHSRGSRGSSSELSDTENKDASRTAGEHGVSDSGLKLSMYGMPYTPGVGSKVKNELDHDYATLEPPPPPDHDYAILDPEYDEEFYGKLE